MQTTMTETKKLRYTYSVYLDFSGLTAAQFKSRCMSLHHELLDGEYCGEPVSPERWVRLASEVAYDCIRNAEDNKRFQALHVMLTA